MVLFSACHGVLLPFLELVVEPALLAPELDVVPFIVLFLLVLGKFHHGKFHQVNFTMVNSTHGRTSNISCI